MRTNVASRQDTDRVLQGQPEAGVSLEPEVRLSRLHFPAETGDEPMGQDLRQLQSGHKQSSRASHPPDDAGMAARLSYRQTHRRSGQDVQPDHSWVDQLLWPVSQIGTFPSANASRYTPGMLGDVEISTPERPCSACAALGPGRKASGACAVRTLAIAVSGNGRTVGAG